jgi:DnaJ-class molecular chaperone
MDPNKDYYNILGVSEDADASTIKKAYRKLAQQNHPDKGGNADKFKEINEANDVLSSDKRTEYDHLRKYGAPHAHNFGHGPHVWSTGDAEYPFNVEDIFGEMFGSGESPFRQRRQQTRNRNIHIKINVSLREAYEGSNKRVKYTAGSETKTLDVQIPKGVIAGQTMRMRGLGDNAANGAPAGDLLIAIDVINDPHYERSGQNLFTVINLTCFEAMLGTEKIIKTLTEKELKVKIPNGTQPGQKMVLRGQGMPIMDSNVYGDLLVELKISIPTNLTTEQQNLIQDILKNIN